MWFVSGHAVARFVDRFRPDLHPDDALDLLGDLADGAIETGRQPDGKLLYSHPDHPHVLLVVSRDTRGGKATLVTVLDNAAANHRSFKRKRKHPG